MCYKHPGPRCSAHAKKRLLMLRQKKQALCASDYSWEEMQVLEDEITAAELDFDSTPVGQSRLKLRIKQGMDHRSEITQRLTEVQQLRALQLAAIKVKEEGDVRNHGVHELKWSSEDFMSPRKHRKNWKKERNQKSIKAYINYATSFAEQLTTEEATALYWHTSDGSSVVTAYLNKKKKVEDQKWSFNKKVAPNKYPQAMVKEQVAILDSVFSKHQLPEPVLLYRGIGMNALPDEVIDDGRNGLVINEYLAEKYPVGSVVDNNEYMSTSADPAIAHKFSGHHNIILEVKTKQAVPVGCFSAWHESEREFVVNRGGKYKVVAIQKNVVYEDVKTVNRLNSDVHARNITVIQLEEV